MAKDLLNDFINSAASDCVNAYAAALRDEAHDVAEGRGGEGRLFYRPCQSCEREHHVKHLVEGWCPQCRGEQPEPDNRRPEYKRRLYRATAKALRDAGHPDRAVWYEENA